MKKKSESQEQIEFIQWCKRQRNICPEIRWIHHIPNGGKRNIVVASKLKLEGVESGVLDIFLPVARRRKHGLYIEMKVKGKVLSGNQKEFRAFVIEQDYATFVAYNAEEAINCVKRYLGI